MQSLSYAFWVYKWDTGHLCDTHFQYKSFEHKDIYLWNQLRSGKSDSQRFKKNTESKF